MLSSGPFFHKLTSKYVALFGNVFNNITIIKKDSNNNEIERVKVPIVYGPKEKYYVRPNSDPELNREVAAILPRMSFQMTGLVYDAARKQNTMSRLAQQNTGAGAKTQYQPVPYDLSFQLSLYSRNIEDADQIIEQILPYFTPDYTVTMNPVADVPIPKDIPIILEGLESEIDYEGNYDSVRYVYWTLNFKMKVYFYGPISYPKIIRKVITNIYNDPSLSDGYVVRVNTRAGNGANFKLDDIVYQGDSQATANAYGTVLAWSNTTGDLVIGGAQGSFKVNNVIRGTSTSARYVIDSFDARPLRLATINIVPDPIDALPNSDFGYTTTITEFPNTLTST